MDLIKDMVLHVGVGHWTLAEITSAVLFMLTDGLLLLTYGLVRQDWAEISAWASLATVVVAIHFMVVAWREVAIREKLDWPSASAHQSERADAPFKDCPECPDMVVIQSGMFVVGANDVEAGPEEGPLRRMMIPKRISISRQAITGAQFMAFAKATNHRAGACGVASGTGPVQCVSWRDAQAYVAWLKVRTGKSFRLPSAAEWEYVARVGTAPPATQTAGIITASLQATEGTAHNGFGVAGMGGAVAELVQDCWSPTLADLASNGQPLQASAGSGCPARVVKSGRTASAGVIARYSGRRPMAETAQSVGVSFRVVREPDPPKK